VTEVTQESLALRGVAVEVEHFVGQDGWDQPGRLFALVSTPELVEMQPDIALELGAHLGTASPLTPVEQEIDINDRTLEELLGIIAWPPAVVGVLAAVERVVLPPEAEHDLPESADEADRFAAEHPEREDVRIVAGVLRTGEAHCVLRLRSHDSDEHLVHGVDLVPALLSALRETLEADAGEVVDEDWGPDE
jgi:hypothetical protein